MESEKKLSPKVTEFFLREGKPTISPDFISQSHFKVPETIRLNATHYFIMKIIQTARISLLYHQEMIVNMNF